MLNPAYGDTAETLAFDSYSSAERDTGRKWIDGTPIYRKVISATGAMATGLTNYAHGITGLSRLISLEGFAIRDDGSEQQTSLPYPSAQTDVSIVTICDDTNVASGVGVFWTGAGNTLSDPIFVLEYTKT